MKVKHLLDFLKQNGTPDMDVVLWKWHGNGHSLRHLQFSMADPIEHGIVLLADDTIGGIIEPEPKDPYLILNEDEGGELIDMLEEVRYMTTREASTWAYVLSTYGEMGYAMVKWDEERHGPLEQYLEK